MHSSSASTSASISASTVASTGNGYSMGSLPVGVSWRYVDVLNDPAAAASANISSANASVNSSSHRRR
jgi:hypothetical protein